ncbi:Zinc finger CCCH-type [Penicillium fimorum]|uniref:Zinc finger CCCH-type n=1 Tax=Penicillium fimorum TaxID=1882269 RepID=A0A9W9XYJ8_9EURO|nr:Zinc finger CCCH-type [Penicillium fimorum]
MRFFSKRRWHNRSVLPRYRSTYNTGPLAKEGAALSELMDEEHQPAKWLKDAIALRQKTSNGEGASIFSQIERLRISTPRPDNQITLGARLISIKAREFVLPDKFRLLHSNAKFEEIIFIFQLNQLTIPFLEDCRGLIIQAKGGSLFRIVIKPLCLPKYPNCSDGIIAPIQYPQGVPLTEMRSWPFRLLFSLSLMPMQLAKCSECGASIGGRNHQAVKGVSRVGHME